MKIGLFTWPLGDLPFEKVLRFASKMGCEAVEIATDTGRETHIKLDKILSGGSSEYKRLVNNYGLEISALSCHIDSQLVGGPYDEQTDRIFKGVPEEKIRYGVERVKKTIEAAALLDVTTINGFMGCVNFSWIYPWPGGPQLWNSAYSKIVERWSPLLDLCKSQGVKFAHEPFPQQQAFSVETAKELLKAFNMRKELGFNLDPANLLWFLVDPVVFVEEFGDRIYSVHGKDAEITDRYLKYTGILPLGNKQNPQRGFRFRAVGWGQIDWKKLITALLIVNYDGVISIEHEDPWLDRIDGCLKAFNFLKQIIPERVQLE